jgi:hypothetical protein
MRLAVFRSRKTSGSDPEPQAPLDQGSIERDLDVDSAPDGVSSEAASPDDVGLRDKTLRFPMLMGPQGYCGRPSAEEAPFLVELDRETTLRFIADATHAPMSGVDPDYVVELMGPGR